MPIRARTSNFRFLIAVTVALTCTAALAIALTIWWLRSNTIREATKNAGNLAILLAEQSNQAVEAIDLVLNDVKTRIEGRTAASSFDFKRLLSGEDTYQFLADRLSRSVAR